MGKVGCVLVAVVWVVLEGSGWAYLAIVWEGVMSVCVVGLDYLC